MSITRKMLKAMGIEEEKIDQIIEAHTETTDAIKAERDKYKGEAEKVQNLTEELEAAKKAAENAGTDAYKVKYDALKEEFEGFKADITAKETKSAKSAAYEQILRSSGINEKRIAAVLKVSDIDSIEFNEDGSVKDADKLTEAIKSEWSDFIVTSGAQGANPAAPPTNNNSNMDLGELSMEDYIKARTNS